MRSTSGGRWDQCILGPATFVIARANRLAWTQTKIYRSKRASTNRLARNP
jgi:hypothetical protein